MAVDGARERSHERALGRAGRADEGQVLAGEHRENHEPDGLLAAEKLLFEGAREGAEPLDHRGGHRTGSSMRPAPCRSGADGVFLSGVRDVSAGRTRVRSSTETPVHAAAAAGPRRT